MRYSCDYYKAIVTLKNGAHKLIRVSYRMVAHLNAKFQEVKRSIFNDIVTVEICGYKLCINDILKCKFINERTHEELLTIC